MNEIIDKIIALLSSGLPQRTLAEVIVDVVVRGIGKRGGRPLKGNVGVSKPVMTASIDLVGEVNTGVSKPDTKPTCPSGDLFLRSDPDLPDSQQSGSDPDQTRVEQLPPGFAEFWALYPKRKARLAALRAWKKMRPPIGKVREALAWQINTEQWRRKVIPNPATWINGGCWTDEPEKPSANGPAPSAYKSLG